MTINVKALAGAGAAALAVALAAISMFGPWSTWSVSGAFDGTIGYGLQEGTFDFGGEDGSEPYEDGNDIGAMFDWTTGMLIAALIAGGLAALVLAAFGVHAVPPDAARLAAGAGIALSVVAALLLIAAPIQVAIGFPASVRSEGESAGPGADDGPDDSFWGERSGFAWGAGWGWYVSLAAAAVAVGAAVLGALALRDPRPAARWPAG